MAVRAVKAVQPPEGAVGPPVLAMVVAKSTSTATGPTLAAGALAGLIVAVGAFFGWALYDWWVKPGDFKPGSDYAIFAGLFVAAQAIERLLEPISGWYKSPAADLDEAKQAEGDAATALTQGETKEAGESVQKAATKSQEVDQKRKDRSVFYWGLASGVGMVLSGVFGLFLIRAISTLTDYNPNRVVDLIVTGLVIGSGTKPLHDLQTRITKKKEAAQDDAAAGGTSGGTTSP